MAEPVAINPSSRAADPGFTLIELMVVLAVVGILAFITVPAYERSVTSSRLLSAEEALTAAAIEFGQYQEDHMTYLGGCPTTAYVPDVVFSCPLLTATTYQVVATGSGPLAGFKLAMDQAGDKATTAAPPGWNTNPTCWIKDPQGDCLTE